MFQPLLARLSEGFEKRNIPYMVIGGQAVLVYGEPRLTKDIDITLGVDVDRLGDILEVASSLRMKILPDHPSDFVRKTMVLPCLDEGSGVRVDLVFSFSPYERQALERVRRITLEGRPVCFASPEDLLIHKVVAGRPRDLEDAKVVLRKNPSVDKAYIEKWLADFGKALDRPLLETWGRL